MQTVLRLIKDDRLRAVQHIRADFLTPVGGQAVHDQRIGLGVGHEGGVHLELREDLPSRGGFFFLAHGGPDICVDSIGLADGFGRVMGQRQDSPRFRGKTKRRLPQFRVWIVPFGAGEPEMCPDLRSEQHQRVRDIVAVADIG